jgi:uncharacterized alkaline shock family protein YloU
MSAKKDNLPINIDVDLENGGTITYANEVIAIIAGVAANEIDGIAGMCTSGGFGDILGRNRNITRGVKVEIGSEEASVDLYAVVEYGKPIQKVASEVQDNVRKAIESMTSLHVVRVDVHVQGVSFEKEKKAVQKGIESANMPILAEPSAVAEVQAVEITDAMSDETIEQLIPDNAAALDNTAELPPEDVLSDVAGAGPEISYAKMGEEAQAQEAQNPKPSAPDTAAVMDTPASSEDRTGSAPAKKPARRRIRKA